MYPRPLAWLAIIHQSLLSGLAIRFFAYKTISNKIYFIESLHISPAMEPDWY